MATVSPDPDPNPNPNINFNPNPFYKALKSPCGLGPQLWPSVNQSDDIAISNADQT